MTVELLSEAEGDPAAWPVVTPRRALDNEAVDYGVPPESEVEAAIIWRRLEAWIAHRWPARSVTWLLRGPGDWSPRLAPFTLSTAERWNGAAWETATPDPAPLGYALDAATWRISGTAGDDSATPADVLEAWRRLHEYARGVAHRHLGGAAIYQTDGDRRPAGWAGKAIHLSGAADLLRPYRRLGA